MLFLSTSDIHVCGMHVHKGNGSRPNFPYTKYGSEKRLSQIEQTFIFLCKKSRLKHSAAEFQSIQQFWLQLDIVLKQNKIKLKCRCVSLRRLAQRPETGDFFLSSGVINNFVCICFKDKSMFVTTERLCHNVFFRLVKIDLPSLTDWRRFLAEGS